MNPARLMVAGLLLGLDGCAVGPDFVLPQPPPESHYNYPSDPDHTPIAQGIAQTFASGAMVPGDWWRIFGSEKLNSLVGEALDSNQTLQSAQSRLRASEYNLRAGYGIFYPDLDFDASYVRQQFSPLKFGQRTAPGIFNLFTLSASVSYAVDLFGGEHRTVEGLAAQSDEQKATVRATALTLVSNVMNTAIAKAAYAAEIETTHEMIAIERQQENIASVQSGAGTGPYSAVLSIDTLLHTLDATLPGLEQKQAQADHLLAVLTGKAPADVPPTELAFDELSLPQILPVSLPSELVRQRPDIAAAEAALHVASANVGVATAALFPSLAVTAGYGANGGQVSNLFSTNSQFWNFGVGLAQPLFDGGTLWFKRKAAKDEFDATLSDYRQTVLNALQQVADTLRALEHDGETLSGEDQALGSADQALHLVQTNYQAGLTNYTQVLIADMQYQQAKLADVQAMAVRYQDAVALYVAMGGGWQQDTTSER